MKKLTEGRPRLWCRLFHRLRFVPGGIHCWDWFCIDCKREGWFSDD